MYVYVFFHVYCTEMSPDWGGGGGADQDPGNMATSRLNSRDSVVKYDGHIDEVDDDSDDGSGRVDCDKLSIQNTSILVYLTLVTRR